MDAGRLNVAGERRADVRRAASPGASQARAWGLWAACGFAALAAWLILRGYSAATDPLGDVCALHRTFGLACPTCGLTRAFALLAGGHLGGALALHPMAPLLIAELAAAWAISAIALARGVRAFSPRTIGWAIALNWGALLAVWVTRLATGTLPQ